MEHVHASRQNVVLVSALVIGIRRVTYRLCRGYMGAYRERERERERERYIYIYIHTYIYICINGKTMEQEVKLGA